MISTRLRVAADRRMAALSAVAVMLAACSPQAEAPEAPPVRPVRTLTVALERPDPAATFPGRIEAQEQASLGFRIGGRVTERLVGVGATVKAGEILARLDPENELNDLRSARAALAAAEGVLRQAEGRFDRQQHLYARNVTSRAEFEDAGQGRKTARAQVEAAAAKVRIAEDVVGFTTLKADAPGVVTAIGAEPGEVVSAGRMIVTLARRGGRDAVFDVPADSLSYLGVDARVTVTAATDQAAKAEGRVREVAPEADAVTRLFRVRVGLIEPPPGLALGSAIQGTFAKTAKAGVAVPAAAIVRSAKETSVWLVDPATRKLALRPVQLVGEDPAYAVIGSGLAEGDVVVTAGAASLKAGQLVRLAGVEP